MPDIGKQYSKDDVFKKKARCHQSKFRAEILKANWKEYGNRLSEDGALTGKNFYSGFPEIFEKAKDRYDLAYVPVYYDMLRSEHIGFNFFIPLNTNKDYSKNIFNKLLNNSIEEIGEIIIEYAPKNKKVFLDDSTSFDAYVEYKHKDGKNGAIGIEVKYTEKDYSYGKTERAKMGNPNSVYNLLTKECALYKEASLPLLKTRKYKQVWRNQLLGEKMLRTKKCNIQNFTSIVLYPKGNTHFVKVCADYRNFIAKKSLTPKFIGITYEEFIDLIRKYSPSKQYHDWSDYLTKRYIINELISS